MPSIKMTIPHGSVSSTVEGVKFSTELQLASGIGDLDELMTHVLNSPTKEYFEDAVLLSIYQQLGSIAQIAASAIDQAWEVRQLRLKESKPNNTKRHDS